MNDAYNICGFFFAGALSSSCSTLSVASIVRTHTNESANDCRLTPKAECFPEQSSVYTWSLFTSPTPLNEKNDREKHFRNSHNSIAQKRISNIPSRKVLSPTPALIGTPTLRCIGKNHPNRIFWTTYATKSFSSSLPYQWKRSPKPRNY